MPSRLEIPGFAPYDGKAICQLSPDGMAFEFFVTDGTGDSYKLLMTAEELYRWAQMRYGGTDQ
jgi:hypothetical protein